MSPRFLDSSCWPCFDSQCSPERAVHKYLRDKYIPFEDTLVSYCNVPFLSNVYLTRKHVVFRPFISRLYGVRHIGALLVCCSFVSMIFWWSREHALVTPFPNLWPMKRRDVAKYIIMPKVALYMAPRNGPTAIDFPARFCGQCVRREVTEWWG